METRSRAKQKNGHPSPSVDTQGTNGQSAPSKQAPEDIEEEGGLKLPTGAVIMFVSLLLDLLAFTMILPLLPSILEYYGNQPQDGLYNLISRSIHGFRELVGAPDTPRWNSVFFGGVIGSLYSSLQFISNPLMGAASDVYGRRPVLLLSLVGISLSHLVWVFSSSFSLFVVARFIGGVAKGNISLSTAVMADLLPDRHRGKGMALVGVAFSLGFLLGPMIGAGFAVHLRSHADQAGVFFVGTALFALTLSLLDLVFVYACFKESLPQEKRALSLGSGVERALTLINPAALFKFTAVTNINKNDLVAVRQLGLVYFLYLFLYSGLEFTLTFLTHNRFNYDSMKQGRMFFLIGLIMILVQGGYVRRLKQGTEKQLALRGMCVLVPCLVLIGVSYNELFMYIGLIMFSFASATVVPCMTTLASSLGPPHQKGTVLGIFRSLGALARALGPVVASTVYWSAGPAVCYVTGGLLIAIPIALFRKTAQPHTHSE